MVVSKIDHRRFPCGEKAQDIEKSAFALPVPKHEAAFGVTNHRGVIESVVIESSLMGSRNGLDRPLADVVPALSVRAVDCYRAIPCSARWAWPARSPPLASPRSTAWSASASNLVPATPLGLLACQRQSFFDNRKNLAPSRLLRGLFLLFCRPKN